MAQSQLSILVNAKNNASPTLKAVGNDLAGIDKYAGIAAKGLQGLAVAGGVAGLASLAQGAVEAGFEMARLAATATDVEASFKNMAGEGSDQMFAGLKESSRGAISDMELMLSANRAMLLGVADSTEEMTALMDVARARSQAMGTTTQEAFSDLVTGLGRGSAAILDNLGIMLDADAVNAAYAESIGKTVSQLTDQEKKQALVNAVMKESADLVAANEAAGDDAASNFERMDAAISNAKVALGELFSPAIVVVANAMAEAATRAAESMKEMADTPPPANETGYYAAQAHAAAENTEFLGQAAQAASGFFAPFVAWLDAASQTNAEARSAAVGATVAIEETAVATAHATVEMRSFTSIMANASAMFAQLDQSARVAARGILESTLMANLAQEAFANLRAEQAATSDAIDQAAASAGAFIAGKLGGEAGLARQKAVTDELSAQRRLWREMGYDEKEINEVLLPGMVSQMNDAERAAFKTATGVAKIPDAVKEAERAFADLESTVAGVLSGALNHGTGVDPAAALEAMGFPREDAINENARRLADIAANGLKDQSWLDEFGKEVPDIWRMIRTAQNPQEEAARLLRDFQDGLLTAPIDKQKVKEIVRRTITGDANMAALATEIATELANEMGIPLQQALAATKETMGGGSGTEAAQNFSDAAAQGLQEAGGGAAFVATFADQMKASYSLLATAGRDAGKLWGVSFMETVGDHVPASLIALLSDLVSPQVFAKFHQQGSLTGSAS